MPGQNFKNHTRLVMPFHFIAYPIIIGVLLCAIINITKCSPGSCSTAWMILGLTVALLIVAWYTRVFALKAQDRAIRSEENLRHFVLTGKPFDSRLHTSQIIALRFAPDEEFVALAARAVAEDMKPKEIKAAIVNWKGDYHRV